MPEPFDPRRAEPNQQFVWHDEYGVRHEAKADAKGVLRPETAAEVRIADEFGLPVARSVIKADKAADADSAPADPVKEG